ATPAAASPMAAPVRSLRLSWSMPSVFGCVATSDFEIALILFTPLTSYGDHLGACQIVWAKQKVGSFTSWASRASGTMSIDRRLSTRMPTGASVWLLLLAAELSASLSHSGVGCF